MSAYAHGPRLFHFGLKNEWVCLGSCEVVWQGLEPSWFGGVNFPGRRSLCWPCQLPVGRAKPGWLELPVRLDWL